MSTERPIIAVRFHTAVTLGTQPHDSWFADRPGFTAVTGKITPRMGNPDFGEQRTSVVFEVRLGNKPGGAIGDIDVEVPASNLAEIQREPPARPQPPVKK
jgi:hypothetical protein